MLYRGYIKTKGKEAVEKFKGRSNFKTLEEVQKYSGYAGVLAKDTILIDIDDREQSDILMQIVEDMQLDCKVIRTSKGRHFLFKNTGNPISRCATRARAAIGLTIDIKVGCRDSYEVLKVDGEERFVEWDIEGYSEDYCEIPKWLYPVRNKTDFQELEAGDGRNQELFNYILTLQSSDFTVEQARETIKLLNKYVLKEPLSDQELDVILRDDAFKKPIFFKDKTFLFDKFAIFLKNNSHVVKINNQLHIYKNGLYVNGYREIEQIMIQHIPNLKKTQRREVIDYMELIAEKVTPADANFIAFRNGILDITTRELIEPNPDIILTNRIEWDYNPAAYSELADRTLNKIACNDPSIRALLEECIGYCFYRRNELGKAFILTGDKNNGKSTFLDCIKAILGTDNISALDLKELGDRFSTSMMFGKLANISDDISDDFLQGNQVATFKKVVTGNRIKAERKGQDPFEFEPYIKLIASANDIPRMRDKTGAVLRRLVIIPFNASFSKSDPDYDPWIKYKLIQQESIEYMIALGIEGLERIVTERAFTKSEAVENQIKGYEEENNPIVGFLNSIELDDIINEPTSDIFKQYTVFCAENNLQAMGNIAFSKHVCKRLGITTGLKRINGKNVRVYIERNDVM